MATASFAIKHITSIPRESAGEDSLHDASFFIQKRAVGKSSIETKKSENPLRKKPHRLKSSVYRADNSCKVREPEAASVKKSIASLYYNYRPSSGDPSGGRATKYGVTWDLSASCRLCKNPESKNFIFPFRLRHHCRFCGRAVCKSCSRHKMMIYGAKKRACDSEFVRGYVVQYVCSSVYTLCYFEIASYRYPNVARPLMFSSLNRMLYKATRRIRQEFIQRWETGIH